MEIEELILSTNQDDIILALRTNTCDRIKDVIKHINLNNNYYHNYCISSSVLKINKKTCRELVIITCNEYFYYLGKYGLEWMENNEEDDYEKFNKTMKCEILDFRE